ncbi:MAG: SDR family oxidoreductase [Terricaulis sp.]
MDQHTTPTRRYALVTGASSGIGEAVARLAAEKGCNVGLTARRRHRLEALASQIRAVGVEVDVFESDLSIDGAGERLVREVRANGREPDILINNAGATITKGYAGTSWTEQRGLLELTVTSPAALAHAFLPTMLNRRWGRIINISSIAALSSGGKGNTLYPAAKSFLLKFSQSLNAEVKDRGVHVTAVLPGFVATEFQSANDIPTDGATRRFAQTAEYVANEAWARNERGHEIVVPGMAPKFAAGLMRVLPEPFMRALTREAAEKYYVGE